MEPVSQRLSAGRPREGNLYLRFLGHYLAPYRGKVLVLALSLFAASGLQLYTPQLVRQFIDQATAGGTLEVLVGIAIVYLVLAVGRQLLAALSTYLSADVGWSSTNQLRADLFGHTLRLDLAYHKERTPGELIERIDGDVTSIANFFSQFLVQVTGAVLLMGGILVVLWLEDWRVGLVLSVFTLAVTYVLFARREVAVPATRAEREASAQVFGFVEERLAGLDDIRANGAGRYTLRRFLEVQRELYARGTHAWWMRGTFWLLFGSLFSLGNLLALGMGIGLYLDGSISLGTVYLFFNYVLMLEAPVEQITQQLQEFQRAAAGMRRVSEMLQTAPQVRDGSRSLPQRRAHAVEFRGVRFAYEDQNVLKGLSFRLEPGQTLGLLGRTGSGKTTLIRLLFRLYDATEGQVLLDGIDLRDTRLDELRQRVGLVTQDVQLFHGTVRDNLTFFDPAVPDGAIRRVLGDLGLGEWLEGLPNGLDTVLRSGGAGLSAGESQLLAFARVFLKDPGLVILDEPSSRLDPATERLLTRAIDRLLEGRTGIIIAHRLETVERVDKIMVLSQGEILEFGDRAELAADPGSRYHAMLRLSSEAGLDEQMERLGV
ncbi:putative ABC transporter ATP-binding protein [Calidithermus terrae]|uniref:Putative ABC transporter ATP-binding protein n=1 Tax=Calidithermus terrae TaxID=1408545 RepID=A0A399EU50_9DEIN|nr:ABC transporter ATP-binding protein [Calidithermus terrae]RIH85761.1 putative ABC transporter ATP-binding protein [Calidithermus terrae]